MKHLDEGANPYEEDTVKARTTSSAETTIAYEEDLLDEACVQFRIKVDAAVLDDDQR